MRAGTSSPSSAVPVPDGVTPRSKLREFGAAMGRRTRRFLWPLVGFLAIIGAWQGVLLVLATPSYLVPKPSDVVQATVENAAPLAHSVLRTASAAALGLGLAVALGVGGAIILGFSKRLEEAFFPYAIVLQTTPIIAVAPLIVIWFGAGIQSIVIISFLISFFPMISNTLVGLNSVDADSRNLFRLHRASKWKTMRKLRIPAAMPYIMAGMKISSGLSVIGAIVGEFVAGIGGGRGGLGYVVEVASSQLDTPYLIAAALAGSLMGIVFFLLVDWISKRFLSWHESVTVEDQPRGGG